MRVGFEQSRDFLFEYFEHLQSIGVDQRKIDELKYCVNILHKAALTTVKFNIGEKVQLVKEIDFEENWCWLPSKPWLQPGIVGTVSNYGWNVSKNKPVVHVIFDNHDETIFNFSLEFLQKI